jgi:hypothetical protein
LDLGAGPVHSMGAAEPLSHDQAAHFCARVLEFGGTVIPSGFPAWRFQDEVHFWVEKRSNDCLIMQGHVSDTFLSERKGEAHGKGCALLCCRSGNRATLVYLWSSEIKYTRLPFILVQKSSRFKVTR